MAGRVSLSPLIGVDLPLLFGAFCGPAETNRPYAVPLPRDYGLSFTAMTSGVG